MRRLTLIIVVMLISIISISQSFAHGEEDFAKAEEIIKQKISCDELTDDQLEILGDYYMEQMHPGELHEIMDERMGGEGSENLRQAHINIGLAFYCGEHGAMSANMMGIMMGRNGMMRGYYTSYDDSYGALLTFVFILLIIIILILLIVLLFKQLKTNKRRR